jgi:VanZ family protein
MNIDLDSPRLRRTCRFSAWALYAAIVVVGSLPDARAEVGEYFSGLVLHAGAYATLTLLRFVGDRDAPVPRAIRAVITVAAMGAFDEFVQSFLPYRTGSPMDWALDCAAALLTATAAALAWPWIRRRAGGGS